MAVAFSRDIADSRLTFEVVEDRGFPFRLRDVETGPSGTSREPQSRARVGSRLEPVATYSTMWFAWAAFNRDPELFEP